MEIEVGISAEAHADLGSLPKALLPQAYALIIALKKNPYRGQPLGNHVDTGDLSDCRKLYFDRARWRIVYQLLPDDKNPRKAAIICVGRRANLNAYITAARRLGRYSEPPPTR